MKNIVSKSSLPKRYGSSYKGLKGISQGLINVGIPNIVETQLDVQYQRVKNSHPNIKESFSISSTSLKIKL